MLKKNNLYFGILIGFATPIIAFLLSNSTMTRIESTNKSFGYYIIAALINLLFVRYYYRNELSSSARGIILITFISTAAAIFFGNLNLEG